MSNLLSGHTAELSPFKGIHLKTGRTQLPTAIMANERLKQQSVGITSATQEAAMGHTG